MDGSGNVYVTGYSHNGSNYDYLTVAYDSAGTELWQYIYNGGGDDGSYIAVVSGNALYVSGYSVGQREDFFTIKFTLAGDTTAPSDPAIGSTSPLESVWSSDNTVDVSWSGAADEVGGSGLAGYSIEWNTTPISTPDSVVDIAHATDPHSTTSPALGDGNAHYFHLSTCDNAGNCTSTVHAGPFWIDTTAPGVPGAIASSSHDPSGTPVSDATIDVAWGAASDLLSGVASLHLCLRRQPDRQLRGQLDGQPLGDERQPGRRRLVRPRLRGRLRRQRGRGDPRRSVRRRHRGPDRARPRFDQPHRLDLVQRQQRRLQLQRRDGRPRRRRLRRGLRPGGSHRTGLHGDAGSFYLYWQQFA